MAKVEEVIVAEEDKKKLRELRFSANANPDISNEEAQKILEEEQEKIRKRRERFGIVQPVIDPSKIIERQKRFGLGLQIRKN